MGEASTTSIRSCRSQQYVREAMVRSGQQGEDMSGEWYGQGKIEWKRVGPRLATKSGTHINNIKASSSAQGVRSSTDVTAGKECKEVMSRLTKSAVMLAE